jgi:hypothetical protein
VSTVDPLDASASPLLTRSPDESDHDCPAITVALRADLDGDGCDDALTYAGGVLSSPAGRFRVGASNDQVATGRWACHPPSTLALLRPDGDVFVADTWAAPGHDVTLRQVASVPSAVSLMSVDPNGDGCDDLVVHRRDGSSTTVHLGRTGGSS